MSDTQLQRVRTRSLRLEGPITTAFDLGSLDTDVQRVDELKRSIAQQETAPISLRRNESTLTNEPRVAVLTTKRPISPDGNVQNLAQKSVLHAIKIHKRASSSGSAKQITMAMPMVSERAIPSSASITATNSNLRTPLACNSASAFSKQENPRTAVDARRDLEDDINQPLETERTSSSSKDLPQTTHDLEVPSDE